MDDQTPWLHSHRVKQELPSYHESARQRARIGTQSRPTLDLVSFTARTAPVAIPSDVTLNSIRPLGVIQLKPFHRPGPKILGYDIDFSHQAKKHVSTRRPLQVQTRLRLPPLRNRNS